jgi:hypothetical protein
MYTIILDFLSNHLVMAALLVSAMLFYSGYQFLEKGNRTAGLGWQFIGVLVLIAFCYNAVVSRAWYSLIIAVAVMITEIWLIRRNSEKYSSDI